jgi:hypothetical protein
LKLIAQFLAMLREMVSRCLNAVVYVNGFDLRWPLCRASQQQSGGICAAAQCHSEWQRRLEVLQRKRRWQASGYRGQINGRRLWCR